MFIKPTKLIIEQPNITEKVPMISFLLIGTFNKILANKTLKTNPIEPNGANKSGEINRSAIKPPKLFENKYKKHPKYHFHRVFMSWLLFFVCSFRSNACKFNPKLDKD